MMIKMMYNTYNTVNNRILYCIVCYGGGKKVLGGPVKFLKKIMSCMYIDSQKVIFFKEYRMKIFHIFVCTLYVSI